MSCRALDFRGAVVLWVALVASGCDEARRQVSTWLGGDDPPAVATPVAVRRVTEEHARQFSTALTEAVASGSEAQIAALIDWRSLVKRAAVGVPLGDAEIEDFARGMARGSGRTGLTSALAAARTSGDDVRQLRVHEKDGGRWVTFRRIGREGGLEHLDFLLAVSEAGKPVAVDAHLLTTGELVSETVRRAMLPLMQSRSGNLLERLTKRESALVRSLDQVTRMQDAFARGDHAGALHIYRALPEDVQSAHVLSLLYLRVAAAASDEEYQRAIEHLRRHFPADPATAVAEIDYFLLRKSYDEALAAIDRVAANAAPDPYLDVLRANVLNQAARYDEARARGLAALAAEPDLLSAHWALVTSSLAKKDFEATAGYLLTIRLRFDLDLDVEGTAIYNEFVASPYYPKYLEGVEKARGAPPAPSASETSTPSP